MWRRRRDKGRLLERWWFHRKSARIWKNQKEKPYLTRDEEKLDKDLEYVDIRFIQDSGLFMAEPDNLTILSDERLIALRGKLEEHLRMDARARDEDWEDKILVGDYAEDEDYFLGIAFYHVGVKGDYYRYWDDDNGRLLSDMNPTKNNFFIDYTPKRWKELQTLSKAADTIREKIGHVLVFGDSRALEQRIRALAVNVNAAFKKLTSKQRKTLF